ncbi:MAG: hypothetical protein II839_02310, partial [Kiritimatiellae bacterium]|nr:hypothetical protein [Kiritimatiellia bacterium]
GTGVYVDLEHEVQSDYAYHTYFTCTDLKTGAWVAAEDSRKTSELTVDDDVAAVRLRADGPVRFYALGVSDTPYKAGEPLPDAD